MTQLPIHVAIVGAGLGGLAAAISLSRSGHRVTILEQTRELGEIGAGIQIPPNCARILRRWGILDKIEALATKPRSFTMHSYRDGRVLHSQNLSPFTMDAYGEPYLVIHRADYHRCLVNEARRLGVEILLGQRVETIDFEAPALHMTGGSQFDADLIIGADGLKSICRESMLRRPDPPHLTGDLAYRIVVPASEMLKIPELRDLVLTPELSMWIGPLGHGVAYLLGGDRYNLVLAFPDNLPELVNTAEANLEEVWECLKDWDPRLKAIVGLIPQTMKWRLQNSREMPVWNHPSGRFVLLGDACHATLPYIAQGAAMAIEDGAVLGELFANLTHRGQIPDLLTMYESIRKPRTTRIVQKSTIARHVYQMEDGSEQKQRDEMLLHGEPVEDFPSPWADPIFREWLYSYDTLAVAEEAWDRYTRQSGAKL